MSDKRIHVTIDPLGNPKIEAVGFNGVGCAEATKGLEEALAGGSGFDRVLKPEWSNPETSGQTEENRMTW